MASEPTGEGAGVSWVSALLRGSVTVTSGTPAGWASTSVVLPASQPVSLALACLCQEEALHDQLRTSALAVSRHAASSFLALLLGESVLSDKTGVDAGVRVKLAGIQYSPHLDWRRRCKMLGTLSRSWSCAALGFLDRHSARAPLRRCRTYLVFLSDKRSLPQNLQVGP